MPGEDIIIESANENTSNERIKELEQLKMNYLKELERLQEEERELMQKKDYESIKRLNLIIRPNIAAVKEQLDQIEQQLSYESLSPLDKKFMT
ncbi:MAG: hypothetical protein N3E37_00220 [Candidatus Micrarchaeota archaeon]|nr:hypothetical protein [Candidatus Micrarchaeota archaeon]